MKLFTMGDSGFSPFSQGWLCLVWCFLPSSKLIDLLTYIPNAVLSPLRQVQFVPIRSTFWFHNSFSPEFLEKLGVDKISARFCERDGNTILELH